MEPRFRNAKAVICRSFARIAETNLKKQGVLPLWFADPATYDEIGEQDRISMLGLADLAPDQPVRGEIHKPDGTVVAVHRHPHHERRADRVVPRRRRPQHHPQPPARLTRQRSTTHRAAPGT